MEQWHSLRPKPPMFLGQSYGARTVHENQYVVCAWCLAHAMVHASRAGTMVQLLPNPTALDAVMGLADRAAPGRLAYDRTSRRTACSG